MMAAGGVRTAPAKVLLAMALQVAGGARGVDLSGFSRADRQLVEQWARVLVWARDGGLIDREALVGARRLGLGRMQYLVQAYLMAQARVPDSCGPAIVAAPARGASIVFQPMQMQPKGEADWEAQPAGYRGRNAVRAADVFDKMARAAQRKGAAQPFSAGQVSAGRDYGALVEFVSAGGVKLSSLEGRSGGTGGMDWIERYSQAAARLRLQRARIGAGAALSVRRVRPSQRDGGQGGARLISDRVLVDSVCVVGSSLRDVLLAHGWASSGQNIEALQKALADALERLRK